MMIATGPHRCLLSNLTKLLEETVGRKAISKETKKLNSKSLHFLDFGARIKIVVSQEQDRYDIRLEVYFPQGHEIRDDSLRHLRTLYGSSVTLHRQDDKRMAMLAIRVSDTVSHFNSNSACALSLSQIRMQALGAPIWKAFSRLESTTDDANDDLCFQLGSYEKCGTYHCISTKEKSMIVFVVSFEDDIERCLAKLFLQQFEATQTKVALTPHCEFRKPTNLTKELNIIADNHNGDRSMPPPVGYLSFTFFFSNLMTEQRKTKAVELLVTFLPYMDGQVKSTKSMMLSQMRKKKDDLITMLPQATSLSSSCSASSANISTCNGNHTCYLKDVSDALSGALQGMREAQLDKLEEVDPAHLPIVEAENPPPKVQLIEGRQRVPHFRASVGGKTEGKVQEQCLIESSPNSVRVSFLFKQQTMALSDPLEASILYQWMRFFQQQAEDYKVLRRKPVEGYSISFLILSSHLRQFGKQNTQRWILNFCAVLDKECSDIKIQVNAQARCVTTEYFKAF